MWSTHNYGELGFDIKGDFICLAVYEYLNDVEEIETIETVLNSIFITNPENLSFNDSVKNTDHLVPYLTSQIYRENLNYKFVLENYPDDRTDLKDNIDLNLVHHSNMKRIPNKEINNLILNKPRFLDKYYFQNDLNSAYRICIYKYLKEQIKINTISKDELNTMLPYMWKYVIGEIE